MPIQEGIGSFLDAVPVLKKLWRWVLERHMDIELYAPHSQPEGLYPVSAQKGSNFLYTVNVGPNPHIYIWADLALINNKTSQRERIIGCSLQLTKRHNGLWKRTIAEATVEQLVSRDAYSAVRDVPLEPMSKPTVITIQANGEIKMPVESLPRKMELALRFRMVGPIRRMYFKVADISHDPKILETDKEGSQTQ
jgi:hypothetical protein